MHSLAERIQKQDMRALARAITLIENETEDKLSLMSDVFSIQKQAHYIGITGSPGAGKSSLINQLLTYLRQQDLTVAVIAVDPTSPFSGGALLGDRTRMNQHFLDPGIFIRSMATRGSLGGLARATKDTIRVCDAYGFDVVLVETVGVGQSELDIMKVVDTTGLVLTPNSGDVLQIFKAGIMEIADLFIINKADLPGVRKLKSTLREYMMIVQPEGWEPPIVQTVSTEAKGMAELYEKMRTHREFLYRTDKGVERRKEQFRMEVYDLIREEIWREVKDEIAKDHQKMEVLQNPEADPYQLARSWFKEWVRKGE
ncbi:LAO/AO transport system kinase [Halobacillus karajensis]|uniref:GTPase/MT1543 n=1 Tax=Halobacillus karajensis TaxID=195088 RepID=A0A024P566_9BACI|nr:methylmalonyl Co-A mutase-associated GTPase MeaB [Halobacillus karajensis]CDQ18800.1 putative GTPase/MT1543 [Halobacillus karajensis]CDQ23127.1 putative GTPase/MT1543 [Halobacillus karajensis]CDQ26609.1 putative GTPase/MT1543 [Halobacillus karajensis]SEH46010.1 LAO/AO transport system kinase [Halobacillus karajensis]